MNRRSHEELYAVYTTPPSVLLTDDVDFKLIYCARVGTKEGDEVDREKWKILSRCGDPE